jgi:branched-chain amino acid transport system permease protein
VAGVVLLALVPLAVRNAYVMHVINVMGLYLLIVTGLTFLVGVTGQFSLGQVGFVGIGGYVSVAITMGLGLSFWPALLGVAIGPVLRLRGHVLAMATLAFAEIGRLVTLNWTEVTGGPMGIPGVPPPTLGAFAFDTDHRFYLLILACVVANYLVLSRTIRSRVGRAMRALRDDPDGAAATGVNVARYKIMAFVLAGFFAGLSGALWSHLDRYVNPDVFDLSESVKILTMVVIGGAGSLTGAALGVVTLQTLTELFHEFQQYSIALFGLMMIFILIFAPGGLAALLATARGRLGPALARWRR